MRKEIDSRPVLWAALALCLGLSLKASPVLALGVPALGLLLTTWNRRAAAIGFALLGFLLAPEPAAPLDSPQTLSLTPQVTTVPAPTPWGTQFLARAGTTLLRVTMGPDADVSLGDTLQLSGRAYPIHKGGDRWAQRGVTASLRPTEVKWLSTGPGLFRVGRQWRESFQSFTQRAVGYERAAMFDALCFNADAALEPSIKSDLRRSGVIHIISASGLHVIVLVLGLEWLFRLLPIPRPWQMILLGLILLPYAGAAGLRPPIVRSILMAWFGLGAYLVRRETDSLSLLGLSAIFSCLWDPWVVFDVSFQLSYVIVLALGLFPHYGRGWLSAARASLVASAASLPLTAYYFGLVSLVAVPANLLIAPVVSILVAGAMAAWLLSLLWPAAGDRLLVILEWLSRWVEWVAYALGSWSWSAVSVPPFSPWLIVPAYGAMALLWRPRRQPADYRL